MRRLREDDGVFAVVFAIIMTIVLAGVGTLVVDVGAVYAESRQLQNAADAGALAAAADCAVSRSCSASGEQSAVASLVNSNSNDGHSQVLEVCGSGAGLPSCAASAGGSAHWDCPPPSGGNSYAQVRTATSAGGSSLLPAQFVRALPGMGSYAGSEVKSCARASWGPPLTLDAVSPLAIGRCDYDVMTGDGSDLQPAGPYPVPTAWPDEQAIYVNGTSITGELHGPDSRCTAGDGSTVTGGFAFLRPWTACTLTEQLWYSYPGTNGVAPRGCDLRPLVGHVVDVPVFRTPVAGTGNDLQVVGFAPFFLTGFTLGPGGVFPSLIDGSSQCPDRVQGHGHGAPSNRCIKGFFTTDQVPASGTLGSGTGLGTVVVQLTG